MLADDDDRYPRTFVIGLEFAGEIERAAFEEVLAAVVTNEPRLTALVGRRGPIGHDWLPSGRRPRVEWISEDDLPDGLVGRRINLHHDVGLRVIAVRTDTESRMFHLFHHACCDGLGALAFLGRLYAAYHCRVHPETTVPATRVNPDAISRCRPADDLPERIGSRSQAWKKSWRRTWEVLTGRPARLTPLQGSSRASFGGDRVAFPGSVTHVLSRQETRELRRTARGHAATLNDLLLCAMFRALREWNLAQDPDARRESYQIMVPVDLRSPQHDDLPAANLVSCFFVKQPAGACDDPNELLRSVAARTQYAVRSRSGLIMYHAIRRLTRVPGLLRLVLKAWRTQASALVSYVGDAGRAMQASFPTRRGRSLIGDLELRQTTATGPVRPGTAANLTAGTYAGELVLNLTLDPHQFKPLDSQRMLKMIVRNLLDYTCEVMTNTGSEQAVARG